MDVDVDIRHDHFTRVAGPNLQLEQLASGFAFTEGPVWHPYDKYLVFSDIICNTLYRWSRAEGVSVYRRPSYLANGNTFDRQGRLLTCEHGTSRVSRQNPDGKTEVVASHYEGKALNSPNDIVVKSDGAIYFTSQSGPRATSWDPSTAGVAVSGGLSPGAGWLANLAGGRLAQAKRPLFFRRRAAFVC